jgi:hypothetical protein
MSGLRDGAPDPSPAAHALLFRRLPAAGLSRATASVGHWPARAVTKLRGRPRSCDTSEVVGVLRALVSEGRDMLTVTEFVREIAERVSCSRRTAYRAIHRACDDGAISLPGY